MVCELPHELPNDLRLKAGAHLRIFFRGQENFQPWASASTRMQQFLFPVLETLFPPWSWKKIELQDGKTYSIVLSANEIAKCNQLKNKTNTVKNHCEKSKCWVVTDWQPMHSAMENWFQNKQKWHKVKLVIIITCSFICHQYEELMIK